MNRDKHAPEATTGKVETPNDFEFGSHWGGLATSDASCRDWHFPYGLSLTPNPDWKLLIGTTRYRHIGHRDLFCILSPAAAVRKFLPLDRFFFQPPGLCKLEADGGTPTASGGERNTANTFMATRVG
jgi:hypothetical protein